MPTMIHLDELIALCRHPKIQERRDCANHLGYSVTSDGRVYSHKRKIGKGRGNGRGTEVIIDKNKCIEMNQSFSNKGYPVVCLSLNGSYRPVYVHRLVAEAYLSNPLNLPQVNHIDGNPKNNNVANLEWVSRSGNSQHAVSIGRIGGEKCNLAKLSVNDVLEIRRLAETKMLRKDIAAIYGIIPDYIRMIQKREVWRYVDGPTP